MEIGHQPFLGDQIGAPPPLAATAGRLNRVGVSFLYLATDKLTAAAEVGPTRAQAFHRGLFFK